MLRKSLISIMVLGIIVGTSLSVEYRLDASVDCPISIGNFFYTGTVARSKIIEKLIPSIGDYKFVDGKDLDLSDALGSYYDVLMNAASSAGGPFNFHPFMTGVNLIIGESSILSAQFDYRKNDNIESKLSSTKPQHTFIGSVSGSAESLVSLYIRPDEDIDGDSEIEPGFISGFIISEIGTVNEEWNFVEPIRPLLLSLAQPFDTSSVFGNPDADYMRDKILTCFSEGSHIVYQANTEIGSRGQFDLSLTTEFSDNAAENSATASGLDSQVVSVASVGDGAFLRFYENVVMEKGWWEGQTEVLNLVSAFYKKTLNIDLKIRSYEIWEPARQGPGEATELLKNHRVFSTNPEVATLINDLSPGDGDMDVNALQLLCHFSHGVVLDEDLVSVEKTSTPQHQLTSQGVDMIAHLFSGYDLSSSFVGDSGGGICSDGCGGTGKNPNDQGDILGIAEGIGGYQTTNTSISACDSIILPTGTNASFSLFDVGQTGHHSISQQVPERELCSTLCPSQANRNYHATLYQRFLIVAHEIGHNLGFKHSSISTNSVMQTQLTNDVKFRVFSASK